MPKEKNQSCAPKTAVAYARYSSAGQRDVSIEQQLGDIRAFAAREGYMLVHEYADHAKSGFKHVSARTEFQAMLAAAEAGSFDTVIAWKVDRFGRNREESAIFKGRLRRFGVSVVYAMEPIPEGAAGVLPAPGAGASDLYLCHLRYDPVRHHPSGAPPDAVHCGSRYP